MLMHSDLFTFLAALATTITSADADSITSFDLRFPSHVIKVTRKLHKCVRFTHELSLMRLLLDVPTVDFET